MQKAALGPCSKSRTRVEAFEHTSPELEGAGTIGRGWARIWVCGGADQPRCRSSCLHQPLEDLPLDQHAACWASIHLPRLETTESRERLQPHKFYAERSKESWRQSSFDVTFPSVSGLPRVNTIERAKPSRTKNASTSEEPCANAACTCGKSAANRRTTG